MNHKTNQNSADAMRPVRIFGKAVPQRTVKAGLLICVLLLLGAVILGAAGCGRKPRRGRADTAQSTEQAETSADETDAEERPGQSTEESSMSAESSLPAEKKSYEAFPANDPQYPAYIYREDLTQELYKRFANENSNNTDESSPYRSLTAEFLKELDAVSLAWLYGDEDSASVKRLLAEPSFIWPDDPFQTEQRVDRIAAGIYQIPGTDMDLAEKKILLRDMSPRHYLFVRVFYDPERDSCRIYMANALIR